MNPSGFTTAVDNHHGKSVGERIRIELVLEDKLRKQNSIIMNNTIQITMSERLNKLKNNLRLC